MQCYQSGPCQCVWRPSVISQKRPSQRRPHQGGPQKRDPLDESPTGTAKYRSCAGISKPIANSGWRRTARSPDSQKNQSGLHGTNTRIEFPNQKMPSKHGLQCTPYLVGRLTPLESHFCTKVECTPAIAQRPQQCSRERKGQRSQK